jgi:hypothetical protein
MIHKRLDDALLQIVNIQFFPFSHSRDGVLSNLM